MPRTRAPKARDIMTNPSYPQPNPYPQQPYGQPYPQPPKKTSTSKVVGFVILGIVVLCGFGGCVSVMANVGENDSASATATSAPGVAPKPVAPVDKAPPAPPKPDHAPAGTPVRDGKFEFQVTQVETGVLVAGDNMFLKKKAQGQYILVHTTVTNTSNKPQTYFGSNQRLYDVQGRRFSNDTMAEINVNEPGVTTEEINPGNTLDVIIAFDVPVDAQPAVIEFHDSVLSGGVKVAVQ